MRRGNEFSIRAAKHKYEIERGRTSNLAYFPFMDSKRPQKGYYLIDTPGKKQKSYKVLRALSQSDAAVLVLPFMRDIFH